MAASPRGSVTPLFGRADGAVLDLPGFDAAADGGAFTRADPADFIPMPEGALLLRLPGRSVGAYEGKRPIFIDHVAESEAFAVAAALPPGYTRTLLPAFAARPGAPPLPLYGYAAVGWKNGAFAAAAIRTDTADAWATSAHPVEAVRSGVARLARALPDNAVVGQLSKCALEYGCYTAQNVFLRQGEAAIPVSCACNARCIGCISEQAPGSGVLAAQPRINKPAPIADIVAVAVGHLADVSEAVVSFGQGCEGEPLLSAPRIAAAMRAIRAKTSAGVLHCNTNASRPSALEQLCDAGLQSMRVSLNSVRPHTYASYYRPLGYDFDDVCASIRVAARRGIAISLNLLTHPGVTDDPQEIAAFDRFLRDFPIAMVQTRSLNIDPEIYFEAVGRPRQRPYGMRAWLDRLRREFPHVRVGNFTRGFG